MSKPGREYGPVYRWYLVVVGIMVIMVSAIDRRVLSLLLQPIQDDIHLTDVQLGLLGGLAFGLFYAACAIPVGRLVDSGNRPVILSIGVFIWSLATMGCGLAGGFTALFLLRMTVAVGEATGSPATIGMVADVFMGKNMARMVATTMTGVTFGGAVALIGGGYILDVLKEVDVVHLPFGVDMKPWQVVFLAAGLPGLILAPLILFTIRDPERRRVVLDASGQRERASFAAFGRFLREHKAAVGAHAFGYAIWSIGDKCMDFWGPTYLIRAYDLPVAQAGYTFGIMAIAINLVGSISVGWLVDRANRAGHLDAAIRIGRNAALLGIVPIALFPFMPNIYLSVAVLVVAMITMCGYSTVTIAQAMIAPNQVRAQYTGMYLLISNIVGAVIGISLVAVVSEYVLGDRNMLGYSLALVCSIAFAIAAVILTFGMKPYARSMAEIGARTAEAKA